MIPRFILTLGVLACAVVSQAEGSIIYTSVYEANGLPDAATPAWYAYADGGATASTSGGVLAASTMASVSTIQYWAIGRDVWGSGTDIYGDPEAWNTSAGTIDFRLKVTESFTVDPEGPQGFLIQVVDKYNRFWNFQIGDNRAYSTNAYTGTTVSVDLGNLGIDTSEFNIYRIAMYGGVASLYVNDLEIPIFDEIGGVGYFDRTAIFFGNLSGQNSSAYELDYLRWSNTDAYFAAPIPEPGALGLLGAGAIAGLLVAVRKGSKR